MNVPFLDLNAPYHELKSELDSAYQRVMGPAGLFWARKLKRLSMNLRLIAE